MVSESVAYNAMVELYILHLQGSLPNHIKEEFCPNFSTRLLTDFYEKTTTTVL